MKIADIPGIEEMDIAEKILLVEDVPIPLAHKRELNGRLLRYKANPGTLYSTR
ncbi:MAG: addiction module protein [Acidobacteria bacterium]|nr:addiction module protein [Acidobacteriota bacterium]